MCNFKKYTLDPEIKKNLLAYSINKNGRFIGKTTLTGFLHKYKYSTDIFDNLKDLKFSELVWCYINNTTPPLLSCGHFAKFINFNKGYANYCNERGCSEKKALTAIKRKETCLDKYGVSNPMQSENIKRKIKKNNFDKYGEYGFGFQLSNIQKKIDKTFYKNYGGRPQTSDIVKEKTANTNLLRYGVTYIFKDRTKMENAIIRKFGTKNVMQSDQIKKKYYNSILKKYYIKNISQTNIHNYTSLMLGDFSMFVIKNKFDLKSMIKFYNITLSCGLSYKNKSIYSDMPTLGKQGRMEFELAKYFDVEFVINDRTLIKPLELDLYSEKYNFAIEYNGLLWHSEGKSFPKNMKYKYNHLKKTELCEEKGVQLYHIFENEWLNPIKQQIWKSMITSKLGQSERIYARKCTIKEIDTIETRDFLNKNHIQGPINARIRLGLFYKSELVQVMTFRTPTQNKYKGEHNYELSRLCSKIGFNIIGGASKLLKYFERNYNPKFIISYANRRWSQGNVYNKLGFDFSHSTEPNYFYFKGGTLKLESRNAFQKHKLKNKLAIFEKELTEEDNMYNNNYRKIYDSGNIIFKKEYNDKNKKNK